MAADDHDHGLRFDLATLLSRRRLLAGGAVVAAGAVAAFAVRGQAEGLVTGIGADGAVCVKDPVETNGPYPADGTNAKDGQTVNVLTQSGIVREDIRPSFGDLTPIADGMPMVMAITLVRVGGACAPLAGHAVYVWHCDAEGRYSIYDAPDRNYLRGVGITDAQGQVRFTTVFPGCYAGRWPHVHFEVFASADAAVSGDASLLISQFALPEAASTAVYQTVPRYAASVGNLAETSLARDMVFRDNAPEQVAAQMMALTGDAATGFTAVATVGI